MHLGDGLFYLTNGNFSLFWDQNSIIYCKFRSFWFNSSELFIQWVLVTIGIERMIALYFPLNVKRFASRKNAILFCLLNFILGFVAGIISMMAYDIYPNKAYRSGVSCLPKPEEGISLWLHIIFTNFGKYLIPSLIIAIITIILARKLHSASKLNAHLGRKWNFRGRMSSERRNELKSTITIALVSFLHCVIFIPNSLVWACYYILNVFGLISLNTGAILLLAGRAFLSLSIIFHLSNFYLYLFQIPAFRRDFLRIFCFSRPIPVS